MARPRMVVITGPARSIRAVARTAVFFLEVLPMLPSRPLDWVTREPLVERVRYPIARLGAAPARAGVASLLYCSPAMPDLRLDPQDAGDIALATGG